VFLRGCNHSVGPITCWVGRWNGTPVYRRNPPHPGRLFSRCYQALHLPRSLVPSGRFVCVTTHVRFTPESGHC
jgi:hypothetical protein